MNTQKKLKLRALLTAFCAVCLCCSIFGIVFNNSETANANSTVAGNNASVQEIYDYEKSCYSEENLNELAEQLLGSDRTINDLVTAALSAGNDGKPLENSRYVTVAYGRYGSTLDQKENSPRQLSWIPVYISRSNEGHAILTLYLDGTYAANTSISRMETYEFTSNGTWSERSSDTAPSSSYGTSYMRTFVLGNGGTYYTYNINHLGANTQPGNAVINLSDANKFADFVQNLDPDGNTVDGIFYGDVVSPSHIKWQENESNAKTQVIVDGNTYYNFPNEAYGTPATGSYANNNTLNYSNRKNYNDWKNDKVWLPSLTEVGTGDITNNTIDTNGLWKLTASERANLGGNSWLRTAYTLGENANPFTMFCTTKDGTGYTTSAVSVKNGVRPAIHLDLTEISKKVTPPLKVPDTIKVPYNGEAPTQDSIANLDWYDGEAIRSINFCSDPEGLRTTTPRDAGEYYIKIELNSLSNKYFIGEEPTLKVKVFKFVIEKAPLAVRWTYGENTDLNNQGGLVPTGIELITEAESGLCKIYEWDRRQEKVPQVGIRYYSEASGGPQGVTEYPDVKGQYKAKPYIVGDDVYNYNYEISQELCEKVSLELEGADTENSERRITYESWIFLVTERKIPVPEFSNGTNELELGYRGWQEVQIYNVTKYITIEVESANEYKALDYDEKNCIQTFLVEAVGKYTFKANIKDKVNIAWQGGEDQYSKVETKELYLGIDKVLVTVTFTGLLPSWDANRTVEVTLNLLGLYDDGSSLNIEAAIVGTNYPEKKLPIVDNKVTIPQGLPEGLYTLTVRMTGEENPYYYLSDQVHQNFTIVKTPAAFNDNYVVWQYKTGNSATPNPVTGDHNTKDKALEVPYTGNYYQFTLTSLEAELTRLGVKATYTGDTRVTNGGDYRVVVTISAYDRNVSYDTKSYEFYFTITKTKYNLSGIEWDYSQPFVYSGDEYKITFKEGTLPAGLSVSYKTNGSYTNTETQAGNYSTSAEFNVLPEYASNYFVPVAEDRSTYDGNFPAVCQWEITQKIIEISWKTDDGNSNLFFVPVLRNGNELVDYTYEIYENGSWVETESVVSPDTGSSNYRVTAELKAGYDANYVLYAEDGKNYCEFTVDSGKQAITVYIEVNGVKCDDGQQFTYTGGEFTAEPVVDTADIDVNEFNVKYFTMNANGSKGTELSSAPTDVGKYAAVIDVKFINTDTSYISDESETEVIFEIIKADCDVSGLVWSYMHISSGKVIQAHFNANQGKWVDNDGNDVIFSFEYDGMPHELNLVGAVEGLTWSVLDNSKTNAGEFTAYVQFTPDSNHNAPSNFPSTLGWKITKAKVNLDNVQWGYILDGKEYAFDFDNDTLKYMRGEEGDINYTVGLINLPAEIKDFFVYLTYNYNEDLSFAGNEAAAIGVYRTEFEIKIPSDYNPGDNYERFSVSEMPSYVSSSQIWEIADRNLTKPSYEGGWDKFDGQTHYLLDMCGIPEDEIYFFDVEITFTDTDGRIFRDYQGYDDNKYVGFDAGKYIVTFYRIVGGEKVYWDAVEIIVGKDLLTVTWDRTGTIPVAKVDGIYVSDMIETVYTSGDGTEKDAAYILTTDGITFYAEPRVTEKYAKNIGFEMKAGEEPRYVFTSSKFEVDENTKRLPYPQMLVEEQEWTGKPITFAVRDWQLTYYGFVFISDGSLTQTAVGEYKIMISFVKDANACWDGTDGNRDSVTLNFRITQPDVVVMERPVLAFDSVVYTGSAITFSIINWSNYSQYLYQVVDDSDNLTQKEVGKYSVKLRFFEGSNGRWSDGTTDDVVLDFEIKPQRVQLAKPSLVYSWAYFTGNEITFEINRWDDYYSKYLEYTGSLTQTEVGFYTVTLSFKQGANAYWESGDSNAFPLTFEIREYDGGEGYPVTPDTVRLSKPAMVNATQNYTGSPITFEIANWSYYSQYLTYTGSLTQTNVNTYYVTLVFKDGVDACWEDSETQLEYRLTFTIKESGTSTETPPSDDAEYISKPFLTLINSTTPVKVVQYTGEKVTVSIYDWAYYSNYLIIKSGNNPMTLEEAGSYEIVVGFRSDKPDCYWEDTKDRADLKLTVNVSLVPPGTTALPEPVIDNPKLQYTGEKLFFTITNWSEISHYVSVQNVYYADTEIVAPGAVSGGNITLDSTQVGRYMVVVRIKPGENAAWWNNTTDDYTLYFEVTKATLSDATIDDSGSLHLKPSDGDFSKFDSLLDEMLDMDVIAYEYRDKDGNVVDKEDLVEGEDYSVKLIIKDKETFYSYFETNEEVEEKLNDTYEITYAPKKPGEDINKILLVSSICLGVEVVLFIILLIVYSKKKKALAEEDDED